MSLSLCKTTFGLAMSTPKRPTARVGLDAAIERGIKAREWIRDGVLLSTAEFASARGVAPDMLAALQARGELFSLVVDDQVCWPAELLRVRTEVASLLCRALENSTESEKFVFLMRKHGALGARTAAEAVAAGHIAEVLRLAKGWSLH